MRKELYSLDGSPGKMPTNKHCPGCGEEVFTDFFKDRRRRAWHEKCVLNKMDQARGEGWD